LTDHSETAWEQDEIESHLRSAMDALTPNVFDKIDLSTPQEIYVKPSRRVRMYRRMRTVAMAAAFRWRWKQTRSNGITFNTSICLYNDSIRLMPYQGIGFLDGISFLCV